MHEVMERTVGSRFNGLMAAMNDLQTQIEQLWSKVWRLNTNVDQLEALLEKLDRGCGTGAEHSESSGRSAAYSPSERPTSPVPVARTMAAGGGGHKIGVVQATRMQMAMHRTSSMWARLS